MTRSSWFLAMLSIGLSFVASVSLAGCGSARSEARSAASETALLGNPAPDFAITPMTGSGVAGSLKALKGHVVLVDFWGTFCEPCKKSFPKLQEIHAKYSSTGLAIIGVSEDEADDKDKIPRFAGAYGATFALVWDGDKSIAQRYRPETMPSSFIIDKQGVIRFAHVGYREGEELDIEAQIRELLDQ